MVARQRRRGAAPDDGARAGTQPVMGGGKPWVMPAAVGPRGLGLICCLFAIFLNLNTLHHDWTLDDRVAVVKNPDVIGENPLGHMLRNDFVKFPAFGHPWDTPRSCLHFAPAYNRLDGPNAHIGIRMSMGPTPPTHCPDGPNAHIGILMSMGPTPPTPLFNGSGECPSQTLRHTSRTGHSPSSRSGSTP